VLDGLPLRLVDTAGLRDSVDQVEQLGVARAKAQAQQADLLLIVVDAQSIDGDDIDTFVATLLQDISSDNSKDTLADAPIVVVLNKIDLLADLTLPPASKYKLIPVSALLGTGLPELRATVKETLGFKHTESGFIARARHVAALDQGLAHLLQAKGLLASGEATEIAAEEMRYAHNALGEIVGTVTPDDLLGRIFSEFCIGK
jgi:tRNA modification GTPase